MIDTLELREHLQRAIIALAFLSIAWNPLYSILLLITAFLVRNKKVYRKEYIFVLIVLLVIFALLFSREDISYLFPTSLTDYLFSPMPIRMMASIIITLISVFFNFGCIDSWMISDEIKRQNKIYSSDDTLDFENRSHTFIAGTTGSGKTQLIERYIKDSLQKQEPLYIISGKGSNDANSLLDDVIDMCIYYSRKLYIVSMNPQRSERLKYNPFKGCSTTEIADALCNASEFTEPHYQQHLSAWTKIVCDVMKIAKIPYSLDSIIYFMEYINFQKLIETLLKDKKINRDEAERYLSFKEIAQVASTSIARFLNILLGEGKEIMGEACDISASDIRKNNGVLFLDLDSFKYTDFTSIIGAFFINDMRHIISTETSSKPKRIIMDELSSYVTEQIMPLFSQSRSFGYQLVVATQSIADIEQINDKLAIRILENCGQYGILQLNSSDDAETISKIIGTTISVETTRKSTGTHLHPTLDGSKKVVNNFKVSPDVIKELQPLELIFYDKKQPQKIKRIKLKYGWPSE